jgi:CrcB protein
LGSSLINRVVPSATFPWSTFVVNVVGCVVFGLLAGIFEQRATGPTTRTFLLVGVLGGFTTFSTFAFENVEMLYAGQIGRLALNVGGQVLLGVAGLWAGFSLTRLWAGMQSF